MCQQIINARGWNTNEVYSKPASSFTSLFFCSSSTSPHTQICFQAQLFLCIKHFPTPSDTQVQIQGCMHGNLPGKGKEVLYSQHCSQPGHLTDHTAPALHCLEQHPPSTEHTPLVQKLESPCSWGRDALAESLKRVLESKASAHISCSPGKSRSLQDALGMFQEKAQSCVSERVR